MKISIRMLVAVVFALVLVATSDVHATPAPAPADTSSPTLAPTNTPTTKSPTKTPTLVPTKTPTKAPVIPSCPDDPTDSDGDGTPDCSDKCPSDFNKVNPGLCGCGQPDTVIDRNGNGVPECLNGNDPSLIGGMASSLLPSLVVSLMLLVAPYILLA